MLTLAKISQFSPVNYFLPTLSTGVLRRFENPQCQRTTQVRFVRGLPQIKEANDDVTTGISEDPSSLKAQELSATKRVIDNINSEIKSGSHGRLFAVVQVAAKQFKVTTNDIIIIQEFWPPNAGDRIRLEKVLLAGSESFTLIGRPLLPRDLVKIEATVIEKTLSYTKFHFRLIKRFNNFRRFKFIKSTYTMVRINSIEFEGAVDETKDIEGLRPHQVY